MQMHTPRRYPDWHRTPHKDLNAWQRMAKKTKGIITPGNILTVMGLVIVIIGLVLLRRRNYEEAVILILLGRLCDILDGTIAEYTKTKSPVGEVFDALADKLAIFALATLAITQDLAPPYLIGPILTLQGLNLIANVIARFQGLPLHTNIYGKLFGVASWTVLPIYIYATFHYTSFAWYVTLAFYIACLETLYLGAHSSFTYIRKITQNIAIRQRRPLPVFSRVFVVSNPRSSNARRATRYVKELTQAINVPFETFELNPKDSKGSATFARKLSRVRGHTLLCVGGGDGTIHHTVSTLLEAKDVQLKNITLLPLWGGNGNDLAVMLNGLPQHSDLRTIVRRANQVRVHPLKVTVERGGKATVRHAMCYVSFGASALATRELDKSSAARKGALRHVGTIVVLRELYHVTRALLRAPTYQAEIDGEKTKIFEHVFANGSRLAKVERLPIRLTDYGFYNVFQSTKHPSYALELIKFMGGKSRGSISKNPYSFQVSEPTPAQIDGEVFKVPAGATVTISVEKRPILALSTKL